MALLLTMVCNLTACTSPKSQDAVLPESEQTEEQASIPTEQEEPKQPQETVSLGENLPKMDGSTSLIPLEAGVRAALCGISMEEATKQVAHTTTHDSFYHLLNREVDLIFSVPISEEQQAAAQEQGIELEQVPIAKEGFVFVVNAENPVDSLTQQQLRDIYAGHITNWKEVGGKDQEIIAYQRNRDSGSQNYMTTFMGDTPLMDAPSEKRPATMFGLMDVIAVNDYAEQSLGYSVYAYAADMYENGDKIKFLAVDGVSPNQETMASGDYPLTSYNYAIFRADEAQDSPARRLCQWMTSEEGQRAIAAAGYVPVKAVGELPQSTQKLEPYSAVGTGLESWEVPVLKSWTQDLPLIWTMPEDFVPDSEENAGKLQPYQKGIHYTLDCLKDKTLQQDVNAWLDQQVQKADQSSDEFYAYLQERNKDEYVLYAQNYDWEHRCRPSAVVSVRAKNGWLWATVSQNYFWNVGDGYNRYYRTSCQTWDLTTGKRVPPEQLFKKGLDIDEFLNQYLRKKSQMPFDSWGNYYQMKMDFDCLGQDGWAISPEAIYLDFDNPYFGEGVCFSLEEVSGILCTEVYREMQGMFKEKVSVVPTLYLMPNPVQYIDVHDEFFYAKLLDETIGDTAVRKKINQDFLSRLDAFTKENADAYFKQLGLSEPIEYSPFYSWGLWELSDQIAMFSSFGGAISVILPTEYYQEVEWLESKGTWFYDLKTGQRLDWQEILVEDWLSLAMVESRKTGQLQPYEGSISDLPEFCFLQIQDWRPEEYLIQIGFANNQQGEAQEELTLYLPAGAIKIAAEAQKDISQK